MGYAKLGFRIIPPAVYLPTFASRLLALRQPSMEVAIAEALKKISFNGTRRLNNVLFEDLLQIDTPTFPSDSDRLREFLHVLTHVLRNMGVVTEALPMYELRKDAVLNIDDAASQMLSARLTFFKSEDVGGEYATVDNLRALLPMAIRTLAYVQTEHRRLIQRLRTYVQHVGFKLINGAAITQQEKTLFAAYSSTVVGSYGHSAIEDGDLDGPVLAAKETADPLVMEAFELYKQSTEPGPFWKFLTMGSDTNLERLTSFIGTLPNEVALFAGTLKTFGPFVFPDFEMIDSMKWSIGDQLLGITDGGDYFYREIAKAGSLALKPPRLEVLSTDGRLRSLVMDAPDITFLLDDERDCSKYSFQWHSGWRGRVINSKLESVGSDDFFIDVALKNASAGGSMVEAYSLTNTGLADLSNSSLTNVFREGTKDRIMEDVYIPAADGRKLTTKTVDMTDYYVRRGLVLTNTTFGDVIRPARHWYTQPDPNAVAFLSSRLSLTVDQTKRFERILTIAHQAAKFTRLTQQRPVFDVRQYCANVGGFTV